MGRSGSVSEKVAEELKKAIKFLDEDKNVTGITGDSGNMMWVQHLARQHTKKPVFLSALVQLPAITCAFSSDEEIILITGNEKSLERMDALLKQECGVDIHEKR